MKKKEYIYVFKLKYLLRLRGKNKIIFIWKKNENKAKIRLITNLNSQYNQTLI